MERETAKQIHGTFKGLENLEREISNYGYSSSVDQQMGNEFLHSRHPLSDSNAPIDNTEFSQLRNADNILEDSIDSDRVLCEEINAEIDETLADVNRTVSDVKELSMDISRLKVEVQIKREHVDNLKSEALLANQKLTKLEASRKTLSNKDVSDMRNVKQLQVQGAYLESILGRDRSNLTTVSNECVVLEAELQELRTKVIKWNNDRTAVTNEISIELRKLNEEEREVTLLTTEIDKITRSDFKMSESYLENIRSQNVISSMNQPFPTEEYSAPNTSWKELIKSGRNYS